MKRSKRLILTFVYAFIFIFSLFSILKIRYQLSQEDLGAASGYADILNLTMYGVEFKHYLYLKLAVFFVVSIVSYVLMMSSYFMYMKKKFHEVVNDNVKKDLKEINL